MVLKKLARNAAMDGVDLYRRLDEGRGTTAIDDPARIDAVMTQIRASLEADLATPSTLRGWRAQAMFASLVVALDECDLMTFVDTGDIYYEGASVKAPDYFLHLRAGRRILVDVKSPDLNGEDLLASPIKFSVSEVDRIRRFAGLYGAEAYLAFYFPKLFLWSLVPLESLKRGPGAGYRTTLRECILANELSILGDLSVGTVPPLECVITPQPDQPSDVADGVASFTIGAVEYYAGGRHLATADARKIVNFFMLYGGWVDVETPIVTDGRLVEIRYSAYPVEDNEQGFEIVGSLASMYSRLFESATSGPAGVTGIDMQIEPGLLSSLIPHDYKSDELPLWRLQMAPSESGGSVVR